MGNTNEQPSADKQISEYKRIDITSIGVDMLNLIVEYLNLRSAQNLSSTRKFFRRRILLTGKVTALRYGSFQSKNQPYVVENLMKRGLSLDAGRSLYFSKNNYSKGSVYITDPLDFDFLTNIRKIYLHKLEKSNNVLVPYSFDCVILNDKGNMIPYGFIVPKTNCLVLKDFRDFNKLIIKHHIGEVFVFNDFPVHAFDIEASLHNSIYYCNYKARYSVLQKMIFKSSKYFSYEIGCWDYKEKEREIKISMFENAYRNKYV
jgi:hypothetical protein